MRILSRLVLGAAAAVSACQVTSEPHAPVSAVAGKRTERGLVARDLGTLGGGFSEATGINPAGQVVGISRTAGGERHAFLWTDGVMTDLGTLLDDFSRAESINPAGHIVGLAYSLAGSGAFMWSKGTMTALTGFWEANAIDPRGRVAGVIFSSPEGHSHAALWARGVTIDLGTLGGSFSRASGISAAGHVVGASTFGPGEGTDPHAFVWKNGVMTDLGTLQGGRFSGANGVNSAGQVVGYSQAADGFRHAVLWADGGLTDLGTPNESSRAFAINEAGQIVGNAGDAPVLWSDGARIELPTLGGSFGVAHAINPRGQIVGHSETAEGEIHATLWTVR